MSKNQTSSPNKINPKVKDRIRALLNHDERFSVKTSKAGKVSHSQETAFHGHPSAGHHGPRG